jgi:hypothetical protein
MAATMNKFEFSSSLLNIPNTWPLPLIGLVVVLIALFAWYLRDLLLSRIYAVIAIATLSITPYLTQYTMAALEPVAMVIVDRSPSMQLADRPAMINKTLSQLQAALRKQEDLNIIRHDIKSTSNERTIIFTEILKEIKKIRPQRIAAVFVITDGQITDVPNPKDWGSDMPPLHIFLIGQKNEQQAFIRTAAVPNFLDVGQTAKLRLRANWPDQTTTANDTILSVQSSNLAWQKRIPLNQWTNISLPISHPGENKFILSIPNFDRTKFPATQTTLVNIYGLQNAVRLGWQNHSDQQPDFLSLLTRDPMIALNLLPSENINFQDYDYIILNQPFDAVKNHAWQMALVHYLRRGGKVILIQTNATDQQIIPELQSWLPGDWQGQNKPEKRAADVTKQGLSHPMTADLPSAITELNLNSQIKQRTNSDFTTLLEDKVGHSLLAIRKYQSGRMIYISDSDLLHASIGKLLLPRLLLWLAGDPNHETQTIVAKETHDDMVQVEYFGHNHEIQSLNITKPDRSEFELLLQWDNDAQMSGRFAAPQAGVYLISDGQSTIPYVKGNVMTPELQEATATDRQLAPLVKASGGRILWTNTMDKLSFSWTNSPQQNSQNILSLRFSQPVIRTNASTTPLLPKTATLVIVMAALFYAWWRESQ